jgi:hypothetical protein
MRITCRFDIIHACIKVLGTECSASVYQFLRTVTSPFRSPKGRYRSLFSSVRSLCSPLRRETVVRPHNTNGILYLSVMLCFHAYTRWLCKTSMKLNEGRIVVGNSSCMPFPARRIKRCDLQPSFHFNRLRDTFVCDTENCVQSDTRFSGDISLSCGSGSGLNFSFSNHAHDVNHKHEVDIFVKQL